MRVTAIRYAADNYAYWVQRLSSSSMTAGFLVDSGSVTELKAFFTAKEIPGPLHIFTTHKHLDHCEGNLKVAIPGTKIYAGEIDAPSVPGCTTPLKDGESIEIDGLKITAIHVPCHTTGHVMYLVKANDSPNEKIGTVLKHEKNAWVEYSSINRALFTGDTIFVGGCGRFFEGTGADMLRIMDKVLTFPDDLHVFCGHEYTFGDAKFGIQVEPGNVNIKELLEKSANAEEKGEYVLPSTIGDEKKYNVFMRCRTKEVQTAVKCEDPVKCIDYLRQAKNKGVFPLPDIKI